MPKKSRLAAPGVNVENVLQHENPRNSKVGDARDFKETNSAEGKIMDTPHVS
jgi:hypothetical protein